MFSPDDTIVAIATPPGRGAIGVVRVSGPRAAEIAGALLHRSPPLEPRRATFARVVHTGGGRRGAIDQVLATYFPSPSSYTGEDVVEISGHGSPVLLRAIVCAAMRAGARLAQPGEFTLRAFLHGRLDLIQAEAVGDLIDAVTPLQARMAFDQLEGTVTTRIGEIDARLFALIARLEASLDFPDEGYHFMEPGAGAGEIEAIAQDLDALVADGRRGRLVREGRNVVIVGKPNVGKSTLFNTLVGAPRAIVTDLPGTTRDLVTETVDLGGIPVTLVDTAGIRVAVDAIETEGVCRARRASAVADSVVLVMDRSRMLDDDDRALVAETAGTPRLVVLNKSDLPAMWRPAELGPLDGETVDLSLATGRGIEGLRDRLAGLLCEGETLRDTPALANVRHIELVERARAALDRAAAAAADGAPEEFVLADLQSARTALEEVTGRRTSEDVLKHIFERFCIGK